jgi:hypothetical protein
MSRITHRLAVACLVSLLTVGTACSDPDFDSCCECLIGTAPDGSATDDAAVNCWADEGDGNIDDETEMCMNQSQAIGLVGAAFDDGLTVSILSDGCRTACLDACTAVDDTVKFESPVVSAGECTVDLDGVDQPVSNVMASVAPSGDLVEIRATTAEGDWILTLNGVEEGAGSYTMLPRSDFGISAPHIETGSTVVSGTFEVSSFDGQTMALTYTSVLDPGPMNVSGACDVDFTVNDGEVSGWVGLDADEGGD